MLAEAVGKTEKMSLIIKAEEYLYKILNDENSGHDYWHCLRAMNMAMDLASRYDCDNNLIALSALLHDIDDKKIFGGNDHKHLIEFCNANGIDVGYRKKIISIIDFLDLDKQDETVSIETKIVQDADNLDALGAVGLARMFAFGGANGKVMFNGTNDDAFSHYYKRLIKLPELMNTIYAKNEADKRLKFMQEFIEQFKSELQQGDNNG